MNPSDRLRRIVEYRFPLWVAALVVLGVILVIKLMTG